MSKAVVVGRRDGPVEAGRGALQRTIRSALSELRLDTSSEDQYTDRMTRTMTATEAKAKLLALLDQVAAGDEVAITKHGRIVARLVPGLGPHALEGTFEGVAATAADDDELFTTGVSWHHP